jgi:carbon storage regulator CsrA
MLVLSRKVNEEIVIGDQIRITVVRVAGNRIRLGISAPENVTIQRSELVFDADAAHVAAEKNPNSPRAAAFC